ncbi:MAG: thioredoxin domain-containing protein [Deltaproteobacteria bacterium]|nr:thioredoxin domain-containing protein [Deltaproteobacteria bacterium]
MVGGGASGAIATPPAASDRVAAMRAKGSGYRPHARHRDANGAPRFVNGLISETSAYLLQHAHNPVDWCPWGEAAFSRARDEGKLVLLSVGYSTCHWCHVMEEESFEDLEVAALINRSFVAVKVDREERPDVDAVYMAVLQAATGHGGWPMTLVLTPEREPIFAATYLPARGGDRGARIGLSEVLEQVAGEWRRERARVGERARHLLARLQGLFAPAGRGPLPGVEALVRGFDALDMSFDPTHGGFGDAPKFPRPAALELCGRIARRTGDERALTMLLHTLRSMAAGGIHDQLAGGFHRYAVDDQWAVPHFEKMLYDNAQLASAYLEGYQISGEPAFAVVARRILDYVEHEMTSAAGGFFAATDADSAGDDGELEEGRYFTWTPAEVQEVIGPARTPLVCAYYGITQEGNFEGRTVLSARHSAAELAAAYGMPQPEVEEAIEAARASLHEARRRRPAPLLDGKIVAAWNGLMVSAFVKGSEVLGDASYLKVAQAAAGFVWEHMQTDGRLCRTFSGGKARHPGCLDDYTMLAAACIDLYETGAGLAWLSRAVVLQQVQDAQFLDAEQGGYFFTAADAEPLPWRDKPHHDGAEPAASSVAAWNLLRLSELTGDPVWRRRAQEVFQAAGEALTDGMALPKMLSALDFYLDAPVHVVVVTPPGGAGAAAMRAALCREYVPNRVVSIVEEGPSVAAAAALVPAVSDRVAIGGQATAYVCRGHVCLEPAVSPAALTLTLRRAAGIWGAVD